MDEPPSNLSASPRGLSELTAAEARTLIDELPGALDEYEGMEDIDTLAGRASKQHPGHETKATKP